MERPRKQHDGEVSISRRQLLTASATLVAAGSVPDSASGRTRSGEARRVLRIGHLTDVHVQPERAAREGFAAALHHLQNQTDKPDLVLFGGDNVMNVDKPEEAERAGVQLSLWKSTLKNELDLPYHVCIGNHDVLRMDPVDGKQWAVDVYELPGRYYQYDQAGWRFIVLDSTRPGHGGYKGGLDDEQLEWLTGVLQATPATMPVLLLSHIPVLAACAYFDGENEETGDWVVPGAWMHLDARRIKDLFAQHPNVKLCLSGHIHLVDQVLYNSTWYCCNGAVSGGWWKGPNQECQTGYGLVDLYDDGSFRNQYVTFPWIPRE